MNNVLNGARTMSPSGNGVEGDKQALCAAVVLATRGALEICDDPLCRQPKNTDQVHQSLLGENYS
jgi:hypothetical protein